MKILIELYRKGIKINMIHMRNKIRKREVVYGREL